MAAKTRRIEMRADPDSEARIARAAALRSESVSAFVLGAAAREANVVLARADVTMMPAEQFDALLDALDTPDAAPALRRAAAQTKRSTRA
jgi:uncharacterized protein (DUF1778 family)